jgi:hypothetical protein
MKLRFRKNTLRLRVNQREVQQLAGGTTLGEQVHFPGNAAFEYKLSPAADDEAVASFQGGVLRVAAPQTEVMQWAAGDAIGIYFELPANGDLLKVAIEKDLECLDGPVDERDPQAFPRAADQTC